MALFDIQHLSFSYPGCERKALSDVSLTVEPGELLLLCGKSGSGKTTLLRRLKPVLAPHGDVSGAISFDGKPLEELTLREQTARIGYVMQNPDNQIVTDKVWHELAFGLESLGCAQREMRLRVAEMASYFGIQGWFRRDVSELSGGQKQLLNLASVMAMQPDVLILDEPTSQLDPIAAADFLNTVRKLNRDLGTTVILTEHRLEDIYSYADRVVVMENGAVCAEGTPRAVAARLYETKNEMLAALPAPLRIYYDAALPCAEAPLTVRDGRRTLASLCAGCESVPALPPEPVYEETDDPALELEEVWFRYEKDAPDVLRGVSFQVKPQTLFAIVGGNGTGKSTLLRSICGVCRPYRGTVRLFGKKTKDYKTDLFRGNLCMLPQDPQSLFVKKSVREELREMLSGTAEEIERRIADISALCEIEPLLDAHPYDLSGGEQQRAALAKVLLTDPRVLLLDEPTKGIDSFFKTRLIGILRRLIEQGMTVVMVSHDVEFCAACADEVGMFFDGEMITCNTPRRFFAGNSFYTTAANRMCRSFFPDAVTAEDAAKLCREVVR